MIEISERKRNISIFCSRDLLDHYLYFSAIKDKENDFNCNIFSTFKLFTHIQSIIYSLIIKNT